MEIDVDDFLEYPEDALGVGDNNYENAREENQGGNQRRNSSPPSKRRSARANEFVSNKIVSLDESTLDPSLDWYLRIDLDNEKELLAKREIEKKLNATIERIQEARYAVLRADGRTMVEDEDRSRLRSAPKIYFYPPRHNPRWIPVTTPIDRTRLYITLKPDRGEQSIEKRVLERRNGQRLLGEDFEQLLEKAHQLNESKLLIKETEEMTLAPLNIPDTNTVYFTEPMDSEPLMARVEQKSKAATADSTLWVDKYKPRGYIDLLSDDGVNRTLLTWLKLWDECVFGRKPIRPPIVKKHYTGPAVFKDRMFNKSGFRGGKAKNFNSQFITDADQVPTTLDHYKRPVHKIVLLSGTPGVGKTTLAHIVARHAGYHVQEMNASDDRTLEAFRKQIEGATQMQATLDGDRRPHCLIIDEIDGAPAPSINYLVSLMSVADDSKTAPPGKKKTNAFVLRRPIICICNDIYTPALRELRKIALGLQVPPIELNRLADRLSYISNRESVNAEPGCFELMCTKSGFDVRSCINSLQLLTVSDDNSVNDKGNRRLTLSRVTSADVGGKDMQRSLFSTWQEIFQLPKQVKRTSQSEPSSSSASVRVKNVLRACEQCGEADRLHAGLFENYLLVDFRDPRLESVILGLDWLGFMDQADRVVMGTQMFELKRYTFFISAVFHLLFANRQFTKLVYPQMVQETYFKISRSLATVHSLMSDVKCTIRAFLDRTVLVTDILPLLLEIVQPKLRPVNIQLYNEYEKALLQRVVNIMRDYNLTYRQQRSASGQYEFVLEPPVEEIVRISTPTTTDQKDKTPAVLAQKSQLSNSVKQAIAREIELVKVRHKEPKQIDGASNTADGSQRSNLLTLDNKKQSIQDQTSLLKKRIFGLNLRKDGNTVAESDGDQSAEGRPIWFKYNAGCNSAIRRFLRVSDLL